MFRLRPVGREAVVQVADINKATYIQTYKSTMSIIVIDFTYLEGRDNGIVVTGWQFPPPTVTGSHHMSLKEHTDVKKCLSLMLG